MPGLCWNAILYMTGVRLELLTDIDQHLFVKSGVRWSVTGWFPTATRSQIICWYRTIKVAYNPPPRYFTRTAICWDVVSTFFLWLPMAQIWRDRVVVREWHERRFRCGHILEVDLITTNDSTTTISIILSHPYTNTLLATCCLSFADSPPDAFQMTEADHLRSR